MDISPDSYKVSEAQPGTLGLGEYIKENELWYIQEPVKALHDFRRQQGDKDHSGGSTDEDYCVDRHSCLALELEQWFEKLTRDEEDVKKSLSDDECQTGTPKDGTTGGSSDNPILRIVDCKAPGAFWQYKYVGGKAKGGKQRRLFHGKGKLTFSRHFNPPHGFDYGMKSGICLQLDSDGTRAIKSLEGQFESGVPVGECEIGYTDGIVAQVNLSKQGVIEGLVRSKYYPKDKDKEEAGSGSNKKRRLRSVGEYRNGRQHRHQWTFLEGGVRIMSHGVQGDHVLAVVPVGNGKEYFEGSLDLEDMIMSRVSNVRLVSLSNPSPCMKVVEYETYISKAGQRSFDFDLIRKTRTKKVVAQLTRFFELVTADNLDLEKTFSPNTKVDMIEENGEWGPPISDDREGQVAATLKLVEIVGSEKNHLVLKTGERAIFDGNLDKKGLPWGPGILQFQSNLRRKDSLNKEEIQNLAETMTEPGQLEEYLNGYPLKGDSDSPKSPTGSAGNQIRSISGHFENGLVKDGVATVTLVDGTSKEGFVVDGALHGLVRHLSAPKVKRKHYLTNHLDNVMRSGGLQAGSADQLIKEIVYVGQYRNGHIDGPGWKLLVGGTLLFGYFHRSLSFTTSKGLFVNQDLETGYIGRFIDDKMMSGQRGKIVGLTTTKDGIKAPEFSVMEERVFR